MIQKGKKVIPLSCQIGDTFFTHIAVKGNLSTNGDLVSKHIDRDHSVISYWSTIVWWRN